MVLLDDNFATLAHAVREGRRVFDSIRKFIKYTLTSNAGEIWAITLAPLIGLPVPLLPVRILWIDLVTDGLPGLFLAQELAESNLMQRPPRPPEESIFAQGMGLHILWVGLLMGGVTLAAQAWAVGSGRDNWMTIAFNVLCLSQMGHVWAIRTERSFFRTNFFSNPALLGAVALTFGLQALVTFVPVFQEVFHTQALTDELICKIVPRPGPELHQSQGPAREERGDRRAGRRADRRTSSLLGRRWRRSPAVRRLAGRACGAARTPVIEAVAPQGRVSSSTTASRPATQLPW